MSDLPKTFNFGPPGGEAAPVPPPASAEAPARKPRGFNIPAAPEAAPVPVEPPVAHKPHTLAPQGVGEARNQRKERVRTTTDVLIDKARQQDPQVSMEIRGKIDMLLKIDTQALIEWGNMNLAPLQQASNIQAEIAAELRRINVTETLGEARDAACRPPSLFDRVTGKKAEHYEARMNIAKSDLTALMLKAEKLRKSYAPEVEDLHLDALSLVVTHQEWSDPVMMQLGNSRSKTLLQAHQTGTMLLLSLSNCVSQCGQFIEQIDSMLSTTIPQWKLSQQH